MSHELTCVQALCALDRPYERTAEADALFVKAMQEIVGWHRRHCPVYAELLGSFDESVLATPRDCASIPFVLANYFKAHELMSIPRDQVTAHLTSSGTTGQKSQMFFDEQTLGSAQRMLDLIYKTQGWWTDEPANYLLYTYETEPDSQLGTAYTDNYMCKYAPLKRGFLALRRDGHGGHEFDLFGAIAALQDYEREGLPVRVLGFPSFLWFTLKRMRDLKLPPLKLHPDSFLFVSGGWKGYANQAVSKPELVAACGELLGLAPERVRDGYGSVEHCIPYIDGPDHRLRIPVWSRAFARDPETLAVLPEGEPGILHFVSPYITSAPAHSLLTGDLARVWDDHFEVLGRAGTSRNKSCALAASELLRGKM